MSIGEPAWREQAEHALRQKDWARAEEVTRRALAKNPSQAQAWVFLAEALEHQGERAAAWHCFDRGWMLDPQAGWAVSASTRLTDVRDQPIPEWLKALLAVPSCRVVGAILAKNETVNITRCVEALRPAVDEVVVIDTGSEDDTIALAEAAGATVISAEWNEDFGQARRAADAHLGTDGWVLWVDADEFLCPEDVSVPRTVAGLYKESDPPLLLRIVQVNHLGDTVDPNYDTTRMFPLGRGLTWKGRIHEQVVFDQGSAPMQRAAVRIRLDHWGYEREVMKGRGKYDRNIRLLKAWTHDEQQNAAAWGFLGRDLYISGQIEDAIEALYRAEATGTADSHYARLPEVRGVLCEALIRLHRLEEARVVAERATQHAPDHPTGWYWKGHVALLQANERLQIAVEGARKARELAPAYRGIVSFTLDIPQFLAPVTEADALKMQGLWVEALQLYHQAAQIKPDHVGVRRQIEIMTDRARSVANARPVQQSPSTK